MPVIVLKKEVDFKGSKNLTCRDVLSPFITDVNDHKYDQYFK